MLDLKKSAEALKLNLKKKGLNDLPKLEVAVLLDVSGSFRPSYNDGTVQKFLNRIIPFAMVLDENESISVYAFASDYNKVGEVTPKNVDGFVKSEVMRSPNYGGGTMYAPPIKAVLEDFGWRKKGGFAGFFSAPKEKKATLVFLLTDGDNYDKPETRRLLDESDKAGNSVYYNMVAIGGDESDYPFLKKVADDFDTTGLSVIPDLKKFVDQSDDELFDGFLGTEAIEWLKKSHVTA